MHGTTNIKSITTVRYAVAYLRTIQSPHCSQRNYGQSRLHSKNTDFRVWRNLYISLTTGCSAFFLCGTKFYLLLCGPLKFLTITTLRWAGHVARMGRGEVGGGFWVGKSEGNIPLAKPRRRRVDNIKLHLQEVGCEGMDWIELAQNGERWRALMSMVINLRVL